jgi:dTDP-4-dehydrorhamnose reductase
MENFIWEPSCYDGFKETIIKEIFEDRNFLHNFNGYSTIVNCIACTDTYNPNRELHWDLNYKFVDFLIRYCNIHKQKLVHISTDYLYSNSNPSKRSEEDVPVHCSNWYGYTKLLSDGLVQLSSKDYLLIRTSFKPRPFPFDKSLLQFGNFDYVDTIAELIIKLIKKDSKGVYNVGTEKKTMNDLARKTKEDIISDNFTKIHESFPLDITMNIDKLKKELYET